MFYLVLGSLDKAYHSLDDVHNGSHRCCDEDEVGGIVNELIRKDACE